jgi:spermidine/putrescine transport system permease protein
MQATTAIPSATLAQHRPGWKAWLMLAPLLIWLGTFVIAPNLIMLAYSFGHKAGQAGVKLGFTWKNYAGIFEPASFDAAVAAIWPGAKWGFAAICVVVLLRLMSGRKSVPPLRWALVLFGLSYVTFFHFAIFDLPLGVATEAKILWRSIEFAALTTILCLLVGYPVAYWIGSAPEKWRNRLLLLIMIPFWTSFLIRAYAWMTILAEKGLLNGLLLDYLRLIHEPLELNHSRTAVVISLIYNFLPFMILPIYGSVEKLDRSVIEAAMDLGASPFRTFRQVILPLTKPGIFAGILLVFVPAIGMYPVVDLVSGSKIVTIGSRIDRQFIGSSGNWPYGSALGMTVMVLFIIFYVLTLRRRPAWSN